MSFWNNVLKGLRYLNPLGGLNIFSDLSKSGYISEIPNKVDSFINAQTGGVTARDEAMMQYQTQEREAAQDWTAQREDTEIQRRMADMKAAGINPMMAAGAGGVSSSSSGSSASSAASAASLSELFQLATLKPTIDKIKAEKANVEADTALKSEEAINKKEDTRGKQLANEFNELTINSRKEAIELENNLKSAQYRLVYKKMDEIEASMTKMIEEAHTEQEKQSVLKCEAWLKSAEAKQVIEMLPYNKALAEAKTDEARAAAQLSRMHAAYQQKLLDSDYLDNIIRKAEADADSAEAKAALAKIKTAIRTGNTADLPQFSLWEGLFTGRGAMSNIANFLDNFNPLNGLLGSN